MNLLLDTNIVIDYLGGKPPFFDNAKRIMAAGYFGEASLWMSAKSAADAFYVLSHYVDSDRVQSALSSLYKLVHTVSLSEDDLIRAAHLKWPDYEDCLIALAAVNANASFIITRDQKGFDRSPVPAISPDEWLDFMRQEKGFDFEMIDF